MAHYALNIQCPTCTVPVGEACITIKFDQVKPRSPHRKRIIEAKGEEHTSFTQPKAVRKAVKADHVTLAESGNYKGPWAGDYIMYIHPKYGSMSHTGVVLGTLKQGQELLIRPTSGLNKDVDFEEDHEEDFVIERKYLEGWWPGESDEKRRKDTMLKVL